MPDPRIVTLSNLEMVTNTLNAEIAIAQQLANSMISLELVIERTRVLFLNGAGARTPIPGTPGPGGRPILNLANPMSQLGVTLSGVSLTPVTSGPGTVVGQFLILKPDDLIIFQGTDINGNYMVFARTVHTDAQIAEAISGARLNGWAIYNGRYFLNLAQQLNTTNRVLKVIYTATSSVARYALTAAPIVGAGIAVAGRVFQAITPILIAADLGYIAAEIITNTIPQPQYRQGRIQVTNIVASTDADRNGQSNILYYMPVPGNQSTPPQVTLLTTGGSNSIPSLTGAAFLPFRFVAGNGTPTSIDMRLPSQLPFNPINGALPDNTQTRAGIPCDIFMCAPAGIPYTTQRFINFFGATQYLGAPIALSTAGTSNGITTFNLNTYPRMFYMNWYSANNRNNGINGPGRVGHQLAFDSTVGIKLNAYFGPNDPRNICGQPGSSQLGSPTLGGGGLDANYNSYFIYLGTVLPWAGGTLACMPTARFVWNLYNRMAYSDINYDSTPYWDCNRLMINNQTSPLHATVTIRNIWAHYYVDPTDNSVQLPPVPLTGLCQGTVIGPVGIEVCQYTGRNGLLGLWQTSAQDTTPVQFSGNSSGLPMAFEYPAMIKSPTLVAIGGLNIVQARQYPSSNYSFMQYPGRRWGFSGSTPFDQPLYWNNYGYVGTGPNVPATPPAPQTEPSEWNNFPDRGGGFGCNGAC